MKIGLVKHLNARPLTFGFEKNSSYELVFDNPSVLKEMLLEKKLDIALISSVECIRHRNHLNFSDKVGVCAKEKVRSILYFQNLNEPNPKKLYTDIGSRTSVALLQILLFEKLGYIVEVIPTEPKEIFENLNKNIGSHLLFGDNALLFQINSPAYEVKDLATWWFEAKKLGFIFAFWAYPKELVFDDSIFLESLEFGLKHMEEIISHEKRFSKIILNKYLKDELHYIVTENDKNGFYLFQDLIHKYKI